MSAATGSLARLIGSSDSLAHALRGAARAATSDSPVLVLGEAGTGRSSVARALHAASGRREAPLVEVDVGTLPASLFESELFGYRAGAFSGAERDLEGRVARARGGTLVLDHVEELPLEIQPKLLRLLAEGYYAPLGGGETAAEVRVVALASDELPERIRRGLFREDLFFRLDVLSFSLPPLRGRLADLEALVEAMLAELRERFQRPGITLAPSSLEWMRRYRWPGNLRELRNVLERSLVLSTSDELAPSPPEDLDAERPRALRALEREEIVKALAFTRGRQGEAAKLLGISRKALWEKRRRYGLP